MAERVQVESLGHGFWRVTLNFGFMNTPDVPKALKLCEAQGLPIPPFETSYFLSRETIVPTSGAGMARWRQRLFAAMSRNASSVAEYFRLPDNAVIELGTRVQVRRVPIRENHRLPDRRLLPMPRRAARMALSAPHRERA